MQHQHKGTHRESYIPSDLVYIVTPNETPARLSLAQLEVCRILTQTDTLPASSCTEYRDCSNPIVIIPTIETW